MKKQKMWLLLALLAAATSYAGEPLEVTNLATLARGFPLPVVGHTEVLPVGHQSLRASLDLVNEFHFESTPAETLRVDGETVRYGFLYRRALAPGFEASIEVPLYAQNGGVFDDVITGFHSIIGQSSSSRDAFPARQYVFNYQRGGVTLLDRRSGSFSFGDVSLYGGWQFRPGTVIRGQLKLPAGAASRLAGNGAASASVWVDTQLPGFAPGSAWSGFVSGGTGYALRGDVLPGLQEHWVLFGGGGLAWRTAAGMRLMAQAYGHNALYKNSTIDTLSGTALILALGARWRLAPGTEFDFSILEDLFVGPAPDFTMRLGLNWGLD